MVHVLAVLAAGALLVLTLVTLLGRHYRDEAIEIARRAVCKTNLKGFVNALVIYEDTFGRYPSLGNASQEISADPLRHTGGDSMEVALGAMQTSAQSRQCNLQPLYLLHLYSQIPFDQFGCPSDAEFVSTRDHKDFDPDDVGFYSWHNVSYAFPPFRSAYKCEFTGRFADTTMYMMGDRPQAGSLESGSANHEDGAHFLQYCGAVTLETRNTHPIEGPGKNVYLLDMPEEDRAEKEIFLHYQHDNVE